MPALAKLLIQAHDSYYVGDMCVFDTLSYMQPICRS